MVSIQTGNMLDVVVEGKSIGLKQRDSDHRKHEVIWLPEPENLAMVLLAEIERLNPGARAVSSSAENVGQEDLERAFFCAKRALSHLKEKNHEFKPLECDGCKEIGLFLTEPGYRGDEHNPVGADFERPY